MLFCHSSIGAQVLPKTYNVKSDSLRRFTFGAPKDPVVIAIIDNQIYDWETFRVMDKKQLNIISYKVIQKKRSIRRFGDHGQACAILFKTRNPKNKKIPNH
jgi:hypothetical protein